MFRLICKNIIMKHSFDRYLINDFLEDSSFVSYVKGTDPDHVRTWENWLEKNPPNRDVAEKAFRIVSMMKHEEDIAFPGSVEEEFERIVKRIRHHDVIRSNPGAKPAINWIRLAASIIILLSAGTGYLLYRTAYDTGNHFSSNEVVVPKGSRTRIVLEDGSIVWLNAQSTLKYPASFSRHKRNVELTGEAYFDVVKDTDRPFIVKTSEIRINVLGTKFNVKAYPNDDVIETTLESGLIHVEKVRQSGNGNNTIVLRPRQKLVLYKGSMNAEISEVNSGAEQAEGKQSIAKPEEPKKSNLYSDYDTELATSWKDGKLIFKSESLDILARRLEKCYNVNIRIADSSLNHKTYTGTFEKETVEQALEALCFASGIKFTIEKNNIVIYQ